MSRQPAYWELELEYYEHRMSLGFAPVDLDSCMGSIHVCRVAALLLALPLGLDSLADSCTHALVAKTLNLALCAEDRVH